MFAIGAMLDCFDFNPFYFDDVVMVMRSSMVGGKSK